MNENPQLSPALMLRRLAFVMRISRALYAAAELGLADILATGPMTSEELATKVEVNPGPCAGSCARSSRTASLRS